MKIKRSYSDRIFDVVNIIVMLILLVIFTWPLWFVVIASISDPNEVWMGNVILLPKKVTLLAYEALLEYSSIWTGYKNTIFYTVVGTLVNLVMTVCAAYPLSRKDFVPRNFFMIMFMITMYFSGGLIPTFLNIRELGMYNSLSALIIPGCLSLYNAFIVRTAIEGIPDSLYESAYMDGASELQILFKITLPLIKPTLAVILLYYGVGKWNEWFSAAIYIKDNAKLPIQNILRSILIENSEILNAKEYGDTVANSFTETIKYAAIVISTVPILCIYPMVQKHFTKGVMIGAVKG